MTETFQITPEQAAAYEELFVPALFAQWAPMMVDLAGFARATGSSTSPAAPAWPPAPRPTASAAPDRSSAWTSTPPCSRSQRGSAPTSSGAREMCPELPFPASELRRGAVPVGGVLLPRRRPGPRGDGPGRATRRRGRDPDLRGAGRPGGLSGFDAIVRRIAPGEALDLLDTYWSMGICPAVCGAGAGRLPIVETRTTRGTVRYGTVENLVQTEIKGTPLADRLSQSQIDQILTECATILNPFVTPERGLEMPITAHLVAARRAV